MYMCIGHHFCWACVCVCVSTCTWSHWVSTNFDYLYHENVQKLEFHRTHTMYLKIWNKRNKIKIKYPVPTKYKLDAGSRQLRDLDCRRNQCTDAERVAWGVYFGFQGDLNPIVADDSSCKVFILQQRGNEKYDTNTLPVDMAETKELKFFVWLLLVEAWTATVMKISEES